MIYWEHDNHIELEIAFGETIQIDAGEMLLTAKSNRTRVTQNCFEKLNRDAFLKEHGEALLYEWGWMP